MVAKYLNSLKTQKNLSWQEISDLSNIPMQTVRNVFSGETTNPGINTVIALVLAMGGSMDEMAGIAIPGQKSSFEVMCEKYEARLTSDKQSTDERIASTKKSYEDRILQLNSSHDRQIDQLNESHNQQILQLTESNERRIKELNEGFERRNRESYESFERRIAENAAREEKRIEEAEAREKRASYHFYAMAAIIAILLIALFYLVVDALHGNWGIFQYQELLASMANTGSVISGNFTLPL